MKLSTLCYIKKDGKTLMLHRNKKENDIHEGKWVGLGGKMEEGETPEACVIREVQEESGLIIEEPKLHGVITFPKFKDQEDWYVFLFSADKFSGEITRSPEGDLYWIEDENLFNLNMWEGDYDFLDWMQEGRFFSGKIEYDEKRLINTEVIFY